MKYIIVWAFLVFAQQAVSKPVQFQISKELYQQLPDSVKPRNYLSVNATELIKALNAIDELNYPENISELDSVCHNAAHQYVQLDTREEQCEFLEAILNYYFYRHKGSDPEFVLRYSDTLMGLIGNSKEFNKIKFSIYIHRGTIYISQERFVDAYNDYQLALEVSKQENNPDQISLAYSGLYFFYYWLQAYDKALACLENHWEYINKKKSPLPLEFRQYFFLFKTECYLALYRDTRKQHYLDTATSILSFVQGDDVYSVRKMYWYLQLSELYYYRGDFKKSNAYADSANSPEILADSISENYRKIWLGLSFLKTGKSEKGLKVLKEISLDNLTPPTDLALEAISQYYFEHGHFKEALLIQKKLSRYIEQSIMNKNRLLTFEIEQKFDLDNKHKQIELLKAKAVKNTWIYIFIISSTVLLILILFLRSRAIRKRSKLLTAQLEEKVEFEILRIRQKEVELQRKIGQSIHDDFAGTIAGVVQFLNSQAFDKDANTAYSQMAAELHRSYERARKYSHDIFYAESEKNFWVELESSIKLFFIESKTTLNLLIDELTDHISPEIKVTILLVMKEALTNILKHAKASNVDIAIYEEDKAIHLYVKDNGIGIPNKVKPGMGIHSIRKRIEDLGGDFNIYTLKEEASTCLEIKIPLTAVA